MAIKLSRSQPSAMEFDGKLLIREVKKRPLLYEKVTHDYSNLAERRKAWIEICETLVKGWETWNGAEKERAIYLATKRWQNMRHCFLRELKAQRNEAGTPNTRRRKYYYHDDMLFLIGQTTTAEIDNADEPMKSEESEKSEESAEEYDKVKDIASRRQKYYKFDTVDLIKAVEKEPVIYDRALEPTSKIKDDRVGAWSRIGLKIYGDQWNKWKSREKHEAVDLLKIRWVNLRTCFMRELKLKKKQPNTSFGNKKRREYIYFKPLKFLLAQCPPELLEKNNVEENDDSESDQAEYLEADQDVDSDNGEDDESTDYFEASSSSSQKAERYPVKREKVEVLLTPSTISDPLHPQYEQKEIDQDLNFALSLVPMMRELSATRKLEVQIQILRLFKNVSSKLIPSVSET